MPNLNRNFTFSGDITEDPTQEVVIYEETYPYPAEYQPQDYYPQHYNYQYHPQKGTEVDRNDNRRVFFASGFGILVSDEGNV